MILFIKDYHLPLPEETDGTITKILFDNLARREGLKSVSNRALALKICLDIGLIMESLKAFAQSIAKR